MKLWSLLLLGLLSAGAATAQTVPPTNDSPSNPPGVTVTKYRWQKDIYIPALFDDPMSPNQQQAELRRQQRIIKKANATKVAGGQTPLALPTREIVSSQQEMPEGPSVNYLYEAKVRNDGAKTIKMITWEYLLFDPETEVEIGRHQFIDGSKIRPGKAATLIGYTSTPPSRILLAKKSDKSTPNSERVVITRIDYDDGTFWQRPLN